MQTVYDLTAGARQALVRSELDPASGIAHQPRQGAIGTGPVDADVLDIRGACPATNPRQTATANAGKPRLRQATAFKSRKGADITPPHRDPPAPQDQARAGARTPETKKPAPGPALPAPAPCPLFIPQERRIPLSPAEVIPLGLLEVLAHHLADQLLEADLGLPAELLARLGRVAE